MKEEVEDMISTLGKIIHQARQLILQSKDLSPILLIITIVLILFMPYFVHPSQLIWPNSGLGADITISWSDLTSINKVLQSGQLPLWDDSIAFGHPIAGNIGTLLFYPLSILSIFFSPTLAISLLAAIHIALLGIFTYYFLRNIFSISRSSATVGALTTVLMPKLMAHLAGTHFNLVFGYTWMPLVLLGAWVSLRSKRVIPATISGVGLALQLPGHPQVPLATLYLLVGMLSWKCIKIGISKGWRSHESLNIIKQAFKTMATIGLTAAGIGAIWWLPTFELLHWISKIEFVTESPFWYQLPPYMLFNIFLPTGFQFPEWTIYIGVVPLFLSILALLNKRKKDVIFLWLAVILALLYSLGDKTPIYFLLKYSIPGIGYFRTLTRLWLYGGFVLAILASLGHDALEHANVQQNIRLNQHRVNLLMSSLLLIGCFTTVGMSFVTDQLQIGMIRTVSAMGLLFLLYQLWLRYSGITPYLILAFIGIMLFDLFPMATGFMTSIVPTETFLKPDPISQFISSQTGIFRIYSPTKRISYAVSSQLGIDRIDAFLNLQLSYSTKLINLATNCNSEGYTGGFPSCLTNQSQMSNKPDPNLLGLLNVRYVVTDSPVELPELSLVFSDDNAFVYQNSRFLPRGFLVEKTLVTPTNTDEFSYLKTIDVGKVAIVDTNIKIPGSTEESNIGTVEIKNQNSGHIRLEINSKREALLLYSEAWAPGWKATLNEKPVKMLRVDGSLMGVLIPAGYSQVKFDYQPLGWQIGWRITIIATIILVLYIIIGRNRWYG